MTRLEARLDSLQQQNRTALVSFITAGDPHPKTTVPALEALVQGGVDIIELGIPFSDPEAEGPSIQRSSERALEHGVTVESILDQVKDFRQLDSETPIILMGYLNSVFSMGSRVFAEQASSAGVDGLIMVNLPPEESAELLNACRSHALNLIFLVAPTTSNDRLNVIREVANGFVYYVSLKGITGASHLDTMLVESQVANVKRVINLPIMVGFGVKTPRQAAAISKFANGVVIGSELVDTMAASPSADAIPDALKAKVKNFRDALDGD